MLDSGCALSSSVRYDIGRGVEAKFRWFCAIVGDSLATYPLVEVDDMV